LRYADFSFDIADIDSATRAAVSLFYAITIHAAIRCCFHVMLLIAHILPMIAVTLIFTPDCCLPLMAYAPCYMMFRCLLRAIFRAALRYA